ncbi:MAG TPA: haloacid dehalogenase type II [Bryobacteraceae bacterium]|jgi:2-haloacid dehalogenase
MPAIESTQTTLVFDVNETLLDLQALQPFFNRIFGDAGVLDEWFHQVILFAQAVTLTGDYRPFGEVASAALEMIAESRDVYLPPEAAQQLVQGMRTLPPHPEVPAALARLKAAGFRMVALTNSSPSAAEAQLRHAGLTRYLDRIFSVESVRRYKPSPEPYQMVATELGVPPAQLRMIAAHAWDIGGAMAVGYSAAFVARPGKSPNPLFPAPEFTGSDLTEVVDAILQAK